MGFDVGPDHGERKLEGEFARVGGIFLRFDDLKYGGDSDPRKRE
jgi:hypothetical protein